MNYSLERLTIFQIHSTALLLTYLTHLFCQSLMSLEKPRQSKIQKFMISQPIVVQNPQGCWESNITIPLKQITYLFSWSIMSWPMQQGKLPHFDLSHPQSSLSIATLCNLIDTIEFDKKSKTKSTISHSQTESVSSTHSKQSKEKSKLWTPDQNELFMLLLKKYGTDFHILSNFFPKKTKNQLKNRYKQYFSSQKKREKEQVNKLKAVSMLFREVEQKYEKDEELAKNN